MTKPLGYYCGVTPDSFLSELEEAYGSQLERLGRAEKILILQSVVQNLLQAETATHGLESTARAMTLASSITPDIRSELSPDEHLGLAEAIINQLKYQPPRKK